MLLKIGQVFLPYIALLIAITIWGALPTLTKLALTEMNVSLFITIRFIFSSIFLSPLIFRVAKKAKRVNYKHWYAFVFTISIMIYSQTWAIHEVPVPLYIVLFSATPVLMALVFRYTMQWPAVIGLFLVVIALMYFLYEDMNSSIWSCYAILAVSISMLSWIAYTTIIKQLQSVYDDLEITAITCFSAAIFSSVICLLETDFKDLFQISGNTIINAAIIGLVVPLAFLGYSYSLRKKPVISIFAQYLEPIIGILFATVLIGSTISLKQRVAFVWVLLGVSLLSKYSKVSNPITPP